MLDDGAKGEFRSHKIYYDTKPEEIDALSPSAPHREIDLEIVKARKELRDKAKIAIMIRKSFTFDGAPSHTQGSMSVFSIVSLHLQ